MKYELFFFKEKSRELDIHALMDFFQSKKYFSVNTSLDEVTILYNNTEISLSASFHLTKMSKVPDIHRLNPKYLDLDIYFSVDPMMPLYKFTVITDLVDNLCSRFNLFVYNVLFNDVSPYNKKLIETSYERIRSLYKEKYPIEYSSLNYINKDKLESSYRYILESNSISKYYNDEYNFLPLFFVKSNLSNKILQAVNLTLDQPVVIPAYTDILYIKHGEYNLVFKYKDVLEHIEKYLHDLPGFIPNTKVIDKKSLKHVKKTLTKIKIPEFNESVKLTEMETLIDF